MSIVPNLASEIAIFNYHPGSYMHSDWLSDFSDSNLDYFYGSSRYYQIISSRAINSIKGNKRICHDFSNLIRKLCFVKDIGHVSLLLGSYLYWFATVSSVTSESVKGWMSVLGEDDYFWLIQSEKVPFVSYQPYIKNVVAASRECDVEKMKFLLHQAGVQIIRRVLTEEHVGLWDRLAFKFPKDMIVSRLHNFSFYSSEVLRNILIHVLVERLPEWQQLTK